MLKSGLNVRQTIGIDKVKNLNTIDLSGLHPSSNAHSRDNQGLVQTELQKVQQYAQAKLNPQGWTTTKSMGYNPNKALFQKAHRGLYP